MWHGVRMGHRYWCWTRLNTIFMSLNIISHNVRGLNIAMKRKSIFNFLRRKKCHVVLLQETHASAKHEKLWGMKWGGEAFWAHGTSSSRGVAILIDKNLSYSVSGTRVDQEGRYLMVEITINATPIVIVNVYAPNKDDPEFFINLFAVLDSFSDASIIIGGDFNLVLDNVLDQNGSKKHRNRKARESLLQYMTHYKLTDIFRHKFPTVKKFSRLQKLPAASSRLDFFLIDGSLVENVKNVDIVPGIMSDHNMATLGADINPAPRGRGYWKFNTSLLNDQRYKDKIRKVITYYKAENHIGETDPHVRWDALKAVVRGETIRYASELKRRLNIKQIDLEKLIGETQDAILNNSETELGYTKNCSNLNRNLTN